MTEHINDRNNGSKMQPIALKAAIVLLAVALQKPSQKLKAKDHQECLAKRVVLCKEGEIDKLLCEGRMIQKRLSNSRRVDPPNAARVFANHVMSGQINWALHYLSENNGGGVLPLSDDVMAQLREKHPSRQEARLGSLLFGPVEDVPDSIYQQINGEMVRNAVLGVPQASMQMGSGEFLHQSHSRNLEQTCAQQSTQPPGQRRGCCPADGCGRSYTENNGKVCYARDKVRCH